MSLTIIIFFHNTIIAHINVGFCRFFQNLPVHTHVIHEHTDMNSSFQPLSVQGIYTVHIS